MTAGRNWPTRPVTTIRKRTRRLSRCRSLSRNSSRKRGDDREGTTVMKPVVIVQNWAAESPGTIGEYFSSRDIPFRTVHLYRDDPLPSPGEIDRAIVLGCPCSVNEYQQHEWLKRLFAFTADIVRQNVPYLGICFGAQLLARVLGARVEKNEVKEIGVYTASLTEAGVKDPIFSGFDMEFPVFHWHGDTFRIPFGATHLATGTECRNQAFGLGKLVGVQFHLEPRPEEVPLWCDEYSEELEEVGKSKDEIIADFNSHAEQFKALNHRLLENFMAL
ncbi:MAG: type 1 glutamine amidotransferase [Candidatus Zixiibacteriota bacterium]|nr:MAG: type 1 glutamine amidotransferase [candidate division Zixibacteria bacterium]